MSATTYLIIIGAFLFGAGLAVFIVGSFDLSAYNKGFRDGTEAASSLIADAAEKALKGSYK